jgi:cerevisin
MRYFLAAFLIPLALATPHPGLAPLSKRGEVIDDSYIVVFKKDINPQQMALHMAGLEEWHSADVSDQFLSGQARARAEVG